MTRPDSCARISVVIPLRSRSSDSARGSFRGARLHRLYRHLPEPVDELRRLDAIQRHLDEVRRYRGDAGSSLPCSLASGPEVIVAAALCERASRDGSVGAREVSNCGGSGIRTHGGLPHTRFPSVPIRPLSHPSWKRVDRYAVSILDVVVCDGGPPAQVGSGATGAREPSQVRKEAALSGNSWVPPGRLTRCSGRAIRRTRHRARAGRKRSGRYRRGRGQPVPEVPPAALRGARRPGPRHHRAAQRGHRRPRRPRVPLLRVRAAPARPRPRACSPAR